MLFQINKHCAIHTQWSPLTKIRSSYLAVATKSTYKSLRIWLYTGLIHIKAHLLFCVRGRCTTLKIERCAKLLNEKSRYRDTSELEILAAKWSIKTRVQNFKVHRRIALDDRRNEKKVWPSVIANCNYKNGVLICSLCACLPFEDWLY